MPQQSIQQPVTEAGLRIRKTIDLPVLPTVAQRLLELVADDEISIERVVETVNMEPSLCGRIVGLASSAYFGDAHNIYTVRDAIIRVLGLDLVKSLAISIALTDHFELSDIPEFNLGHYWKTAMLTANLARLMAPRSGLDEPPLPEHVYLAGLLHNLGLLALLHNYPAETKRVLKIAAGAPEWTLSVPEREIIGIDQYMAGSWLAHRWHLPEDVMVTIENSNHRHYRGAHWQTSLLVGYSSRLAQWRIGRDTPLTELIATPPMLNIPPDKANIILTRFEGQFSQTEAMARMLC